MTRLALRALVLALSLTIGAATTAQAANTASAVVKEKARAKKPKCVRAQVGGKRVCLRIGARCFQGRRNEYLDVGLDCVKRRGKRVLVKASPAAVRRGRYLDLPPSGRPTFAQALAAFEKSVADLPGYEYPSGSVGNTQSGTSARAWLYGYRDRLTPAQRAVLDDSTRPAPGAITVNIDPQGNIVDDPQGNVVDEPQGNVVDEPPVAPPPAPAPAAPEPRAPAALRQFTPITPQQVESFRVIVQEAVRRLAMKGVVLRHPATVSAAQAEGDAAGVIADAWPLWLAPHPKEPQLASKGCSVRIFPGAVGSGLGYQRQVLLHELSHCAQFEFLGNIGQLNNVPPWVTDGTAEYFAYTISQEWNGTPPILTAWQSWLRSPELDLFRRQYDAVGFYFLLAQKGASIPAILGPLVTAGSQGAAYTVANQAVAGTHVTDWGSTPAMIAPLGPTWNFTAPGVPRPPIPRSNIGAGQGWTTSWGQRGAAIRGLELSADIVNIRTSPNAKGHLRDARDGERTLPFDTLGSAKDFCLRPGGCACPGEPDRIPDKLPKGATFVGLADVAGSGFVSVTGRSLNQECKKKKEKEETPGSGVGRGGGGAGLEVRGLTGEGEPPLLGRITSGTCSFTGTAFVAKGSGSGYRFSMRIDGARQPGRYIIPYNNTASFVSLRDASTHWTTAAPGSEGLQSPGGVVSPGGPGRGAAGAVIQRVRVRVGQGKKARTVTRHRISVGATPLFNVRPELALIPGPGGLIC